MPRAKNPSDALSMLLDDQQAPDTRSTSLPLSEARDALEAHPWRFAETMKDTPHWYTVRKQWADQELFDGAVCTIRAAGEIRYFRGWPYLELDLGDFTYWTMGYPLDDTTIINRRPNPGADPDN